MSDNSITNSNEKSQANKLTIDNQDSSKKYTSIEEMIKLSWETTKKATLKLFLSTILIWAVSSLIIFVIWVISFMLNPAHLKLMSSLPQDFSSEEAWVAFGEFILSNYVANLAVAFSLTLIVSILSSIIVGIVSLIIFDEMNRKKNESIEILSAISKSFKIIIPYIILSIIVGMLTLGGFFLFIIPAIMIIVVFSLSTYELILNNASPIQSMKNSYDLVKKNLGVLIERWLIIFAMGFAIGFVLGIVSVILGIIPGMAIIAQIFTTIFQVIFGWFSIAFFYHTYIELKEKTTVNEDVSITWTYVVGVIGLILLFLNIFVIISIGKTMYEAFSSSKTDYVSQRIDNTMNENSAEFSGSATNSGNIEADLNIEKIMENQESFENNNYDYVFER